jgi:hypothetical protein
MKPESSLSHSHGLADKHYLELYKSVPRPHNLNLQAKYFNTRCGKLTSFFELSSLKRRGAPNGWAWSRSREGILKLCDVVVQ